MHPQADVDRIYFKRSEGGTGLMSVEDSVNSEINSLSWYVQSCNGPLLEAVYKEKGDVMLKERKKKLECSRRNNFMHG